MTARRPPRLPEWLLRTLRRSPDTRYLLGDLAEGFARRSVSSIRSARRWYWSQILRALWHAVPPVSRTRQGRATERGRVGPAVSAVSDVIAGWRALTRRPGSAALAILTIAVSVTTAATTISVAYGVLYRPLPWPQPERLVVVWESRTGGVSASGRRMTSRAAGGWSDPATVEALGTYREQPFTVAGPDGAERVAGVEVSASLLTLLGVAPIDGRTFADGDVDVALVSERFARRHFGEGRDWIGRALDLGGRSCTVVGIVSNDLGFPSPETEIWTARARRPPDALSLLGVLARLAPGATPEQAAAEAEARARHAAPLPAPVQAMLFGAEGPVRVHAASLLEVTTRGVRPAIVATVAGVVLLLATALVSLSGLQLARASDRRQELAIRAAIGADRARLIAQMLGECAWLGLAGGGIALLSTWWALSVAPRLLPSDFPRLDAVAFDTTSFVAVAAITLATILIVGLVPSWRATRIDLAAVVSEDARVPVGLGRRSAAGRSRRVLLGMQVAIAVVLLVGAGLVGRTLIEIVDEDLGYAPSDLVMARLIGSGAGAARGAARVDPETLGALIARLGQLPGVTGVALSTALPFQAQSGRMSLGFTMPTPDGSGRQVPSLATENSVTPEYFDLVGMRVVAGRALDDHDRDRPVPAIVVNEAFARAYLGARPLGPFPLGGEVVGIVENIKDRGPGDPVDPQLFTLFDRRAGASLARPPAILLRTDVDLGTIAPLARAVVLAVDERLGLADVTTVEARLAAMVERPRLYALLALVSAGFALLVAAVGLFAVLWHGVKRRRREIGVRTALGATPRLIARQVLAEGLGVALAGAAIGLGLAALLSRYLESLLYRVAAHDPVVFAAAPATLLAVASMACLVPARQAARVDPVDALRSS